MKLLSSICFYVMILVAFLGCSSTEIEVSSEIKIKEESVTRVDIVELNQQDGIVDSNNQPATNFETIGVDSNLECKVCAFEILIVLEEAKESPTVEAVSQFICTQPYEGCENNVEFEEFYSELLFDIIANAPAVLFEALEGFAPKKQIIIIKMFETPVNDLYSIPDLINLVDLLPEKSQLHLSVKAALRKAN